MRRWVTPVGGKTIIPVAMNFAPALIAVSGILSLISRQLSGNTLHPVTRRNPHPESTRLHQHVVQSHTRRYPPAGVCDRYQPSPPRVLATRRDRRPSLAASMQRPAARHLLHAV